MTGWALHILKDCEIMRRSSKYVAFIYHSITLKWYMVYSIIESLTEWCPPFQDIAFSFKFTGECGWLLSIKGYSINTINFHDRVSCWNSVTGVFTVIKVIIPIKGDSGTTFFSHVIHPGYCVTVIHTAAVNLPMYEIMVLFIDTMSY